jgi:hypothetical protein
MKNTVHHSVTALIAGFTALACVEATAAPINLVLNGEIISANSGTFIQGANVTANLWFDLDAANALKEESIEANSTRWTFSGANPHSVAPYNQTAFSGGVTFSNPTFLDV